MIREDIRTKSIKETLKQVNDEYIKVLVSEGRRVEAMMLLSEVYYMTPSQIKAIRINIMGWN